MHIGIILDNCRIVIDSGRIISKTKNIETLLSRAKLAVESCAYLQSYAEKGIPTLDTEPREAARQISKLAAEAVDSEIQDALYQARRLFEDASTDAGKLGGFNKGISRLDKLMGYLSDVSQLELAISKLREERDSAAVKLKVRKADLFISQSKEKRAIDTLIEALHTIQHDTMDDNLQVPEKELIIQKLKRLNAKIPANLE